MLKILGETLLTLAALGGAACIVLVVLAFTGGYSLIMFKTGSMHPTIPAGSVALVKEIPATEVRVGDVLTVDRADALPVTHRVTSIVGAPSADSREITMKGDANDTDDPLPYVIDRARVTIGSVPHLAHVIVWFGSPWVMASITLGAAALVTWAFWPRSRDDEEADEDGGSQPRQPRRGRHALVLVATGVLAAPSMIHATPAEATSDVLKIHSNLEAGKVHELSGDDPLLWDLTIDASAAPTAGRLDLALSARGDARLGVSAEVISCSESWQNGACLGTVTRVQASRLVSTEGEWEPLMTSEIPNTVAVRVALTATPDAAAHELGTLEIVLRADAQEVVEEVRLAGQTKLPETGSAMPRVALLLAPIAVAIGLLLAVFGRLIRRGENRLGEQHDG